MLSNKSFVCVMNFYAYFYPTRMTHCFGVLHCAYIILLMLLTHPTHTSATTFLLFTKNSGKYMPWVALLLSHPLMYVTTQFAHIPPSRSTHRPSPSSAASPHLPVPRWHNAISKCLRVVWLAMDKFFWDMVFPFVFSFFFLFLVCTECLQMNTKCSAEFVDTTMIYYLF